MLEVGQEPFNQHRTDAIIKLFASPAWQDLMLHVYGQIDGHLLDSVNNHFASAEYPAQMSASETHYEDAEKLRTFLNIAERLMDSKTFGTIKVISKPQAKE